MKKDEVPQDGDNLHNGTFRQIFYAVDHSGNYTTATSIGWEPENVALSQAWEEVEQRVANTKAKVDAGELSPIAYYMERTLLDLPLLALKAGKFQWQVKRHMKPGVFKGLNDNMIARYAEIFGISFQTLRSGELLPFKRPA